MIPLDIVFWINKRLLFIGLHQEDKKGLFSREQKFWGLTGWFFCIHYPPPPSPHPLQSALSKQPCSLIESGKLEGRQGWHCVDLISSNLSICSFTELINSDIPIWQVFPQFKCYQSLRNVSFLSPQDNWPISMSRLCSVGFQSGSVNQQRIMIFQYCIFTMAFLMFRPRLMKRLYNSRGGGVGLVLFDSRGWGGIYTVANLVKVEVSFHGIPDLGLGLWKDNARSENGMRKK